MNIDFELVNRQLFGAGVEEILRYFLTNFSGKIAFSSSFGAEDQVLTDIITKVDPTITVFTLDTGRLHEETYKVMDETMRRYNLHIDTYFPDLRDIESLYRSQGVLGFRDSIENRKRCCQVRKLFPLRRALRDVDVWITGLRKSQSMTRDAMAMVEWDETHGVVKVNPLIEWSEKDVWDYIIQNKVPYNVLHDRGYPSIGCAPCTRAIREGEDLRAGRWWWENPEHKECGLHLRRVENEIFAGDFGSNT